MNATTTGADSLRAMIYRIEDANTDRDAWSLVALLKRASDAHGVQTVGRALRMRLTYAEIQSALELVEWYRDQLTTGHRVAESFGSGQAAGHAWAGSAIVAITGRLCACADAKWVLEHAA